MMPRWIALLAVLALVACARSPQPGVSIEEPWSPAAPPGAPALAVYARIVAHEDDTLLEVSSPAASMTELHATVEEDGMMRMRPVGQLEVRAGETVMLEPGGMHLMLMGVTESLPAGAAIQVTFHFANAGDVVATAKVTAPGDHAH